MSLETLSNMMILEQKEPMLVGLSIVQHCKTRDTPVKHTLRPGDHASQAYKFFLYKCWNIAFVEMRDSGPFNKNKNTSNTGVASQDN